MEVKGKFQDGWRMSQRPLLTPLQVIHQSQGTVFGRNTCPPRGMQKDRNPVNLDTGPKQGRSERVREKDER